MSHKIEKYGPVFEAARGVQTYVNGITVYHTKSGRRDKATMREVAEAVYPHLPTATRNSVSVEDVATALKDRSHVMHDFHAQYETVTSHEGEVTHWLSYSTDTSCGSGPRDKFIILWPAQDNPVPARVRGCFVSARGTRHAECS